MGESNRGRKIQRIAGTVLFVVGVALAISSLIPGELSPVLIAKNLADLLVQDRDFEPMTPDFYNRLRPFIFSLGVISLAYGWAFHRIINRRSLSLVAFFSVAGLTFLLVGFILIMTGGTESAFYRHLAGTPVNYVTSTPTPTLAPTPSPIALEPGQWELIAGDLEVAVGLENAGDGSDRLFIVIKKGRIRVIENGVLVAEPYLDIRDRVMQDIGSPEQGLLGMAFHPKYEENGYFFLNYIDFNGNTVISRFQISAQDPNRADPLSETKLFGVIQPHEDHNGGQLAFGPDGYLYIGLGDGGISRDPFGNAQSLDTLLAKILRIDVDHGQPYAIPGDNPFAASYGLDEIWAYGLRNPWRFSFDALTGDFYIADVGHHAYEEINMLPADSPGGANFGWNIFEGPALYIAYPNPRIPDIHNHTLPIFAYPHGSGVCAVIGGFVYRGTLLPSLSGTYVYGDNCSGSVWGLTKDAQGRWESQLLFDTGWLISSFGVDEQQELYLVDLGGQVYKLIP